MGRTEANNCKHDGSSRALPDEILVDILSRVSAEDLARCNCVSKLWNHSLTIQAFMLRHSCSSEATNVNTLTTFDPLSSIPHEPIKILSFEIPKQNTPVNIVRGHVRHLPKFVAKFVCVSNIYHGLACFFNHSIKSLSELSIVLYNIRTNDLITLPKTPNYDMLNPSEIVKGTSSSIGFDKLRKECIIFRMTSIETTAEQKYRTSYETLTLGSGPWKQIDHTKVPLSLSRGVRHINVREFCLDGVIYWIHGREPELMSVEATYSVGTFDLSQEEFRAFDSKNILPECSFGRVDPCHLASLRGCPTLFACQRDRREVVICTLRDHKNADAAWSNRSISIRETSESPLNFVVSEGRYIIKFYSSQDVWDLSTQEWKCYKYFAFQDLENNFRFKIEIEGCFLRGFL